jgi:hypothetical protein
VLDAAGECGVGQGTKQSATHPRLGSSGDTDRQLRDVGANEAITGGRISEEAQPGRAKAVAGAPLAQIDTCRIGLRSGR